MPESHENSINSLLGSGGISQLLQNPEIAAKLPRIMEALAPVMAEMKAEKAAGASAPAAPVEPAQSAAAEAAAPADGIAAALADGAAPAALPVSVGKASSASRRMALLRALSPYLSEERQSALDTVMKVSTLLELLGEVL